MDWISVNQSLPEDDVAVLSFIGGYIYMGWYYSSRGVWHIEDGEICEIPPNNDFLVTHWMPLPEPPKI